MKRRIKVFGAATDDPAALIRRALGAAETAVARGDGTALREAAETGWLAASSTADVAADRMGLKIPGGASGRRSVLLELEKRARTRRGILLSSFESARTVLHGECFHGDVCEATSVVGVLGGVQSMIEDANKALTKLRRGRR